MDPITATTTIIMLATFVKDLIDIGHSIRHLIERVWYIQVGKNQRQIRNLTDDVLCMLGKIAKLSRRHENAFQSPELLSALGNLKAFGSQIKTWVKHDDIEEKIRHLKEHVN
ncbi:hypothetical protein C8R44DRAFT_726671 [Mycena epipterygia]|nr:hypothetical protein C8R44DRAFT_726671 [Mycena epipterygia]